KIALDDPVARYLPTFTGGGKERVTIRLLLEHRSGLPPDRALWRIADSPAEARQDVLDTPLRYAPGERYVYSDLGFDLLGFIVQAVSHEPLDQFVETHVFQPLGMRNTFFRPARSVWARTAPTEVNPPRGYPLQGEVHDENAYALGGVAGHAGLFSTASDLAIFAQMMLNGGEYHGIRIVSDSTVRRFTTRAAGSQALGWAMADGQWGSGEYLGEDAFGHVGYTGTSLWIDPDRQMFVILLTNRVHAPRSRHSATIIEDVRADLCDAASLAVVDDPEQVIAMPVAFRADRERGWNPRRHRTHRRHPSHGAPHRAPAHHPAATTDAKGSRKVTP
ncbi:MAG TPA: serine hydrolase, partial [Gemmatimonadaceae bacterium]|nr:serine hydrolase [Gemmatimonadaceae bacterium]